MTWQSTGQRIGRYSRQVVGLLDLLWAPVEVLNQLARLAFLAFVAGRLIRRWRRER